MEVKRKVDTSAPLAVYCRPKRFATVLLLLKEKATTGPFGAFLDCHYEPMHDNATVLNQH